VEVRSSEGLGSAGGLANVLDEYAVAVTVALERVSCGADVLEAVGGVEAAGSEIAFPCSKPEAPKRSNRGCSLRILEQALSNAQALSARLDIEADQLCTDDRTGGRGQRRDLDFCEADQPRSLLGQQEAPAWLLESDGKRLSGVLGKGLACEIRADAIGGVAIEKYLNRQRGNGDCVVRRG
jgi:hypothetical protein